jgi:hypothetical protein
VRPPNTLTVDACLLLMKAHANARLRADARGGDGRVREELAEGAMKPVEYVREIVLPTAHEYSQNRRSRRLMYLTCMAVFHIKDHLAASGEKDVEKKMRSAIGDSFDVVRAVCKRHKTRAGGQAKSNQISSRRRL